MTSRCGRGWPTVLFISACLAVGACRRNTPVDDGASPPAGSLLSFAGRRIEAFVGSASKPATEAIVAAFEQQTGARVDAHYGGSGSMLAQMKLAGRGDIYFPGSSDYMELAKRERQVVPETERIAVYLIPAINVPKGNPAKTNGLADLAREDVRVGLARPDTVCVGLYAVEVLEKAGLGEEVRPRVVTLAESCEKTAQLVALGSVDAVIGWRVFQYWEPDKIETVLLLPEQVPRIGYIPIAVGAQAADPELAQAFIEFVTGEVGRRIFAEWHYLVSEEEAREYALPDTPVGGEWPLPAAWE